MTLTAPTFTIAVDDPGNVHEVVVLPRDQLRAETEGNRRGLVEPAKQGLLLTFLWLWCAARRTGVVEPDCQFQPFVDRLVAWEKVKADPVDPTREAGSPTSASPSVSDGPESTGSLPSPTTPRSSSPPSDSSDPTTTTNEGYLDAVGVDLARHEVSP